jgi:DNA-binding SARP family transcriptional activator/tetratricopeptide (TPR) repeat protein
VLSARPAAGLYFRALGPLEAQASGFPIDLGGQQRRTVLGILLARANTVVSRDLLVDALWGDRPPASHQVQLQGLISDLRRRLAPGQPRSAAPIRTRAPGYVLQVAPAGADLLQFRADLARGRAAMASGDAANTIRTLQEALARWRGPAFDGIAARPAEIEALALNEERLAATSELIDAQLADGRLEGLAAELTRLVAEHPERERFSYQLMTVYQRTGHPAHALGIYRALRLNAVRELGVEPSAEIQALHQRILSSAPVGHPAGGPHPAVRATAYRQLPADAADFTGRAPEAAALMAAARPRQDTAGGIAVIDGMGGAGKTRLAVHVAHQLVAGGHFGDGQLYVDLRGFSPDGAPADPAEVLESLLQLLGVPAAAIPGSTAERSAVYRDRLMGQQVLVLLDNAADEAQVAPLLPASPASMTLVTSRHVLALPGAARVSLAGFTEREALDLLMVTIGPERVSQDPAAARSLVSLCGSLPLAVAIAARRLRARPAWPISELVRRIAQAASRLDELTVRDHTVESVLALSWDGLPAAHRQVFRQLGHHPGNDFTAASVAAMCGIGLAAADHVLESLLDQHLVQQSVAGRYHLHDLLRAYALRLGSTARPEDRARALHSLLTWYCHAISAAVKSIRRFPLPIGIRPEPTAVAVPDFTDRDHALKWLDAERGNLLSAVQLAAGGWPVQAVIIAHELQPYLVHRDYLHDAVAALEAAEAAALAASDPAVRGIILIDLGQVRGITGDAGHAEVQLREAVALNRAAGDLYAAGTALSHLASVVRDRGDRAESLNHYLAAAALFEQLGDEARLASTLSNLSVSFHLLGRNEEAVATAQRALVLAELSGGASLASLRTNLGHLYARLGRHSDAIENTTIALELHRQAGSTAGETIATTNLSFALGRAGQTAAAIDTGTRAVRLARKHENPALMADALNTLGDAYELGGRYHAALDQYREALTQASGSGVAEEEQRAREGVRRNWPAVSEASAGRGLRKHRPAIAARGRLARSERLELPRYARSQTTQ